MAPPLPAEGASEVNDDDVIEEDPPDGGYGWVCVGACFTLNCFTWGAVSVSWDSSLEKGWEGRRLVVCLSISSSFEYID
jgi:hypothetical protein